MRRTTTTFALAATAALTLSACGGGAEPLTQEQTADVLLTEEEFGIDGWTRGEVEVVESDEGEDGADDGATNEFEQLVQETDGVSQECIDALGAVEGDSFGKTTAGSKVTFSGSGGDMLPEEAELVVVSIDGDSPLAAFDAINEECSDIEIEQDGMTMKMGFTALDGMDGSKISMEVMGMKVEMIMGGVQDGDNIVALMGSGLDEGQVKEIVDRQMEKVADL